jgi:hypothetical protein
VQGTSQVKQGKKKKKRKKKNEKKRKKRRGEKKQKERRMSVSQTRGNELPAIAKGQEIREAKGRIEAG